MFYKIIDKMCFSRARWRQAVVCVSCLPVMLLLLLMGGGCRNDGEAMLITVGTVEWETTVEETRESMGEQSSTMATIWVHVCGQVAKPGVYSLPEDSRVWDAVEAAGGFLPEAAQEAVNLAMRVADGSKVTIPHQQQTGERDFRWYDTEAGGSESSAGLIDINRADVAALMTIPGIGQTRAEAIVSHREMRGPFGSIEEIMEVTGIKDGLYAKIKEYITVGG